MTLGAVAPGAVLLCRAGMIPAPTCSIEVILCARESTCRLPPGQSDSGESRLTPARNNTQHPHAMSTFTCDSNGKPRTGPNGPSSGFPYPTINTIRRIGVTDGTRTRDLPDHNQAFHQLNYSHHRASSRCQPLKADQLSLQRPIYHAHLLRVNMTHKLLTCDGKNRAREAAVTTPTMRASAPP